MRSKYSLFLLYNVQTPKLASIVLQSPVVSNENIDIADSTMSRYREWDPACKIYVGNLRNNASKNELEDTFSKYGPLRNIWVARNPPGFAFIEFEDARDAEDAVRGLDGT